MSDTKNFLVITAAAAERLTVSPGRSYRNWSREEKDRIVGKTFALGTNVQAIARLRGLDPSQFRSGSAHRLWALHNHRTYLCSPADLDLGDIEDVPLAVLADFIRRDAAAVKPRSGDALLERVVLLRCLRPLRASNRHVRKLRSHDTATAPMRRAGAAWPWLAG
jgi:hypothetical protein